MNRREFLYLTSGAAAACATLPAPAQAAPANFAARFRAARGRIVTAAAAASRDVQLIQEWNGDYCALRIRNRRSNPVRVSEVLVAEFEHGLPPSTGLYGESFQMLSQTAGTVAQPADLGYSELNHYRIPQPEGATSLSGLVTFATADGESTLLAFTSCRRFTATAAGSRARTSGL